MIRSKALAGALALALLAGGAGRLSVLHAAAQEPARPMTMPQVNINTATQAELEKLPGVGPSLASRILEYRTKNGGFKKIEDLMNVKGIGEKSFLKLKPQITVTPARVAER
jgi:comEA protein